MMKIEIIADNDGDDLFILSLNFFFKLNLPTTIEHRYCYCYVIVSQW
jgi:hypothetical protein